MNRPTGVTIIAILQWIGGVLSIIGGVLLLVISPIMGLISLILGIAAIVLGVGLWQLKAWAWLGTLIVQSINVLFTVINMIANGSMSGILGLVINTIIIVYLLRPEIKAVFGR